MMKQFGFVIALLAFSCAQNVKQETESNQKTESIDFKTQVRNVLEELEKPFDNTPYQKDIDGLKLEVATFFVWAGIVNKALNNDDEETIKIGRLLYEKVIALQEKEFPAIRTRYSVLIAPKLIRYNAQAEVNGQPNTTLFVYSSDFHSDDTSNRERQRRNSVNFHKSIKETVKLFRFKSVSFSEKRKSSSGSSYTIKSLDDDEIVNFGSSPEASFKEESDN